MQKGRALEIRFEEALRKLNALPGIIAMRLEIKRTRCGIYKGKQPCDYCIITPGQTWFLDTKECSSDVWYPKTAPKHQLAALKKAQSMGKKAGFVVWFKNHGKIRFIEDFSHPATPESGKSWDYQDIIDGI